MIDWHTAGSFWLLYLAGCNPCAEIIAKQGLWFRFCSVVFHSWSDSWRDPGKADGNRVTGDIRYDKSMVGNWPYPAKHTYALPHSSDRFLAPALAVFPTCPVPLPCKKEAWKLPCSQPAISHCTHHFFFTVWDCCPVPFTPRSSLPHLTNLPLFPGLTLLPLAKMQRCCWWASMLGSIKQGRAPSCGVPGWGRGASLPDSWGCGSTQVQGGLCSVPSLPFPFLPLCQSWSRLICWSAGAGS